MHYSNISFMDSTMIAGNKNMPAQTGEGTVVGNSGNGYAQITYISEKSSDSSLKTLKIDKGIMTPEFSSDVKEYNVKLNEDEYIVNFSLETNDPLATTNKEEYENVAVLAGNTRHKINVYAQDGTRTQYIINFERTANSINYIEGITVNNKYYEFKKGIYDYQIILPYDEEDIIEISADYLRPTQKIEGLGTALLRNNEYIANIKVTPEDKTNTTTYHVTITKESSNKLKSLAVAGVNLVPTFSPDTQEYNIKIVSTITNLEVSTTAYDSTAKIEIKGDKNIPLGNSQIQIKVSTASLEDKVYTINVESLSEISEEYTPKEENGYEEFISNVNGKYRIELWGAQGESGNAATGYGAYTSGEIDLKKGESLFIYVGKSGANGGYNGGGNNFTNRNNQNAGGGATDVRLTPRTME